TTATVTAGEDTDLTATVLPANASNPSVNWSSSNPAVATVNGTGRVTGVSAGSAIITVTTQDGNFEAISVITVEAATVDVTGVSVTPTTAKVTVGSGTNLAATVSPAEASNPNVTWSSSNPSVATVNGTGRVTGLTIGTATITVTTQDGNFEAISVITVEAATVDVTGVSVTPTTATVTVGDTRNLTANILPSNASDPNVTWSSSNPAVATVNGTGQVTGLTIGTATITVTTQDGNFTANSNITVNGVVTFNRSTGRYTAPPGSAVEVRMLTYISGKGVASLTVRTASGDQGTSLLSLGYSFNNSSVDASDTGVFIMPPNGEAYFSGVHSDIEIDRISTTEITILNNQGRTEVINMEASTPIQ
ncbi:Ig-like domain-containing protein, partial [Zobellia galactanivorans]|uniref:Ig-like domain-containing protein n=1 Tax=Zobellia galactanivorans (strain DSM 12802 / CCUG 47099 / CIP 106680 / NCIMB 13871 / Dsij) TaxID=63186 RepID=UPI0026E36114